MYGGRSSAELVLLPPSVALFHRKDSHERFHRVNFVVVDIERLPHCKPVTAEVGHAPRLMRHLRIVTADRKDMASPG